MITVKLRMVDKIAQAHRSRAMSLAVLSSVVSKGGNALLMLISVPLAFRLLGEERFGVYGVVQTLMWFITMSDLGMGPGIMRRIAGAVAKGSRADETKIVSCGFFITLGFVIVAAAFFASLMLSVPVTTLFGQGFASVEAELTRNIWVAIGMFLIMLLISMLERSREGYQEIYVSNAIGGVANVVAAAVLYFGIGQHPSVMFLILSVYGAQLVTGVVNSGLMMRKRPWLFPRWAQVERRLCGQMMGEGFALFVAGTLSPVLQREGTKWLLGQDEGPAAVGRYTILIQLGFFLYGFVLTVSRPLWPAIADAAARKDFDWIRMARARMVRVFLSLATLTAIAFTVCGPWLADHWLHKHVELKRLDFTFFSISFILMVWSHLHYVILAGMGQLRRPAMVLALETVATLGLAWLGISHYGLSGALAGMAAGNLLFSAWLLPFILAKDLKSGRCQPVLVPAT